MSRVPPGLEDPVFDAPWEAQAFAMTVALHERGLFSWPEWSAALAAEIELGADDPDSDTAGSPYGPWLAALERLVVERRVTDGTTLRRYRDAWDRAAGRTPHGAPIELASRDLVS